MDLELCEDTEESQQSDPEELEPEPDHAGSLILDLQPPELWEKNSYGLLKKKKNQWPLG